MRASISESGAVACSPKCRAGLGPVSDATASDHEWARVTQALLAEWVREVGATDAFESVRVAIRCDRCGVALDRNTKRRDERMVDR